MGQVFAPGDDWPMSDDFVRVYEQTAHSITKSDFARFERWLQWQFSGAIPVRDLSRQLLRRQEQGSAEG